MLSILLLLLPLIANTNSQMKSQKITCNGIIFNHAYYEKKFVVGNYGKPCNLMFHTYGSTIYFSHTIKKNDEVDFIITSCDTVKKECTDVDDVPGGYAIAYDPSNDDIYFGGHDGIYKYNILQKRAYFWAESGKSIWGIFVRKNFYYIEYPNQLLHVFKNNQFVPVAEARRSEIDQFYVTRFGDIYFANKTALFKVIRPSRDLIVLNEDLAIRQIAEDHYGDIYFCAHDGIYVEDRPYNHLKKVADIDDAYGLTFDIEDHLIYSDKNSIYRLEPSPYSQVCYDALKSHQEMEFRRSFHYPAV